MSKHISTRRESRNGASVDRIARLPSGSLPLHRTWPISLCIGLAIGSIAVSPDAFAGGPTGGTVVGGTGSITQNGNETVINQISQRLALNWETFNLKANESVLFNQPGRSAVALNRILDQNPSQIFGKINSNGQVFLINTHGIIFGATAQMNVGGLMASTLDLTPKDFLAGNYSLNAVGAGAGIVNHGLIQAASGGSVALVGGSVANDGVILANYGSINLDGAEHAVLDFDGNGLINIQITGELKQRLDDKEAAVSNSGTLKAEGGTVVLQASAAKDLFTNLVNNSGVIDASGISTDGGVVRLVGNGGNVQSSGSVTATGDHGGRIELLSDHDVMVTGGTVDASGRLGGGAIRIGGGVRGGEGLAVAARTYIGPDASLNADATGKGDGGSIAVFSRDNSVIAGGLSARGGIDGGNGGFVETSSHGALTITGTPQVFARSADGLGGNWLIDPNNITIVAGGGNTKINAANPFVSTNDGASLGVDLITAALTGGASVTVTTGTGGANSEAGDITLNADLDYNGKGTNSLTFNAANDIVINNKIFDSVLGGDVLNLSLLAGRNISLNNDISLGGGTATLTATAGSISRTAGTISGSALTLTAGGTNGAIGASGAIQTDVDSIVFSAKGTGAVNIVDANGVNVSGTAGSGNVGITTTTSDLGVVGSGIVTAGGAVTLGAAGGGARINIGTGVAVDTTNGVATGANVSLVADNVDILGTINAGTAGIVAIRQATAGRLISLGPDAPFPADPQLGVTSAELDQITANTIVIGDANSGDLAITAAIAPAHATTLSLNTGGTISQVGGATITVGTLTGSSAGATTLGEANQIGNLGSFTASSFSLTNAAALTLVGNVTTSGAQTYNTALVLGGDRVLSGSDITFASTVDGTHALSVVDSGTTTFAGAVGTSNALTSLTTDSGGSTKLGGTITTSGTQTYNDAVTLGSDTVLTTTNSAVNFTGTVDNATTTARALTVNAGTGSVTFGGAVGSNATNGALGALTVNSTGLTTFGNVAAASLATNAGGSTQLGGTITTSGTQTYNDAVTLGGDAVLTTTDSAVNFVGTVDNATTTARALTVNAGTGSVTFGGAVGSNATNGALGSLTTQSGNWSANALNIGSGGLSVTTTTGDITQGGKFVVTGLSGFNAGGHAITLENTDNDFQGNVSVTGIGVSITDINDLTIAALNSGLNGKVSLIAGGVLTLPVGAIDTGSADLTLASNGGVFATPGDLSGANVSLTGLGLALNNNVTATGMLGLFSGAAISQGAGVITAGTLTGGSVGATTLADANQISTLGSFTAAGFNLTNASSLVVTGVLDGGASTTLTTTAGNLAINGVVNGTTTTLTSAGAITEGAGGAITAGTLTGSSVGSTTLNGANVVGALGAFTTGGNFSFNNTQTLTVNNAPSANGGAGNLALTTTGASSDLILASNLVGNTVTLSAGRNINQTAGAITATTLTGSSVGSTTLNGANLIGTLGSFTAAGFNLTNAQALAVNGSVNGGASTALTTTTGDLAINGAVNGTTTTLSSAGAITEGAGGAITAGTLTGSSVGSTTLNGGNVVGALGAFTTGGNFSFNNTQTLTVNNAPSANGGAGNLALTTTGAGSDLILASNLVGNTVTLSAGRNINQTAGAITATTLTGSSVGSTTLNGANLIGTLGNFTAANFALTNAQALAVNGSVNGGASTALKTTAGNLAINGAVNGTTTTLTSAGAITGSGVITAGTLTGSSVGATTLNGANLIGTLGNFTAANFALTNAQALAVNGSVNGGASTALTTTAGNLAINGVVNGTTTTLTSAGAITEGAGGAITAGTLTGSSVGSTTLNGANVVGALGAFTTGGNFSFNNTQTLTVNNAPSANGGAGNLALTTTGASSDLILASNLVGNTVTLSAGRNINQTAGAITATTLTGSSVGSTTLNGANLIGTLGSFTAAGFNLTNAQALAVNGSVNGGASTSLTTTAGDLAINGLVKGATTTLVSAGAITEGAGGSITANLLTGHSIGNTTLDGNNHINILGGFSADFSLTNGQTLTVEGPLDGGPVVALTTTAGDLIINGTVTGATTTLTSAGAIIEGTHGVITADNLTGSSAGSTSLLGANQVAALGAFVSGGDFAFNTIRTLTVNDAPSANGGAGDLTLTASGANSDLILASTLTGNTVTLGAGRNINQTAGAIHANTLTGSSVGSTALGGANHIGTLGNFTAANFALTNAQALAVTGSVDGGASTTLKTTSGNLAINGTVKGTTTTLASAGAITEGAGGSIVAGMLTGSSAGATTLNGANRIGTLGGFTAASFALTNAQTLAVSGTLDGGASTSLKTTSGDLAINGPVKGTATSLTSAGAISEGAAGVITAGTLTGSSVGATTLNGANQIGTLGSFTAANFALTSAQALTVDGPLDGGASTSLKTTSGDLAINGSVKGTATSLTSAGAISEGASGIITAGTLSGSAVGPTVLGSASSPNKNMVDTLGNFTSLAGFSMTNDKTLTLASVAGSAFTVNAGTSPFYLSVTHGDLFQLGTTPLYDGIGVWGSTGRLGSSSQPIYVVGTGLQNIANVGLPPAYFYAVDSSGNLLPLGGGFAINVPTASGAGSAQNGNHGDSYIDPSVITANYRSYGIVPSGVRLPPDQQSGCDPDQPDQAACQDPDALGMVMPWPKAPQ